MSRLMVAGIAVVLAAALPAKADFAAGQAAFNSGDFTAAYVELAPLADAGDARAQYALGVMYLNGLGTDKDLARAAKYYRMGAEQDYPSAQFALGALYEKGRGVAQDLAEAARWYRLAAEQEDIDERWPGSRGPRDGAAFAQNALGLLYEAGRGVPQDLDQARKWFRTAADHGYTPARDNLARLEQRSGED